MITATRGRAAACAAGRRRLLVVGYRLVVDGKEDEVASLENVRLAATVRVGFAFKDGVTVIRVNGGKPVELPTPFREVAPYVPVGRSSSLTREPIHRAGRAGRHRRQGSPYVEDLPRQLPLRCGAVRGRPGPHANLLSLQLLDLSQNAVLAGGRQTRRLSPAVG